MAGILFHTSEFDTKPTKSHTISWQLTFKSDWFNISGKVTIIVGSLISDNETSSFSNEDKDLGLIIHFKNFIVIFIQGVSKNTL